MKEEQGWSKRGSSLFLSTKPLKAQKLHQLLASVCMGWLIETSAFDLLGGKFKAGEKKDLQEGPQPGTWASHVS